VLVGPPASGKSAFQRSHLDWVVVSKNDLRACMFRALYVAPDEETIERVYASALVEAIGSDAKVVCVDALNLSSKTRVSLIEMARIAGRRPTAHVMPMLSVDEHEAGIRRNIQALRKERPHLRISGPSRQDLEALLADYTRVSVTEGFYDIVWHEAPRVSNVVPDAVTASQVRSRKRSERREPLPLFV